MRQIQQLDRLIDGWPVWVRLAVAILLVTFCIVSIYGRINLEFGSKAFSRISKSEIRSNGAHIFRYTVTTIIVTLGYLYLLVTK